MAVVKNLMVRSGADFSALYREMNKAQKRLSTFQKGINKAMKVIGITLGSLAAGKLIKDSISAAMNVENSMLQIQRTMGDSANAFNEWAQTQAKAFGMAREEAFKYGATYSNLISSFTKDTQETARYTTELLKASAVVASATGRTMEDTMERIRSGLLGNTEAIEDLGIHVNVAMLESTEAFRQFARGRSWQQLTFQEQQQIRLLSILEQANIKYGDSLAGTTQTRQLMFLATLKNIRLNLGQAFLPIYNTILPILTALASKLEVVTASLARFMQALFGTKQAQQQVKTAQAQAEAVEELGDATAKAGKQAKGAVASFDEVHQLQEEMSDTAAGDMFAMPGVESPVSQLETEDAGESETFTKMQETLEKLAVLFDPAIEGFNKVKTAAEPVIQNIGEGLKWFYDNVLVPFGSWVIAEAVPAFFDLLAGALAFLNPILEGFKTLGEWLWVSFLQPIASWTGQTFVDSMSLVSDALRTLGDWMSQNKDIVIAGLGGILTGILAYQAITGIPKIITGFKTAISGLSAAFGLLTSPIGLIAIAIGALVGGFIYFYTTNEEFRGTVDSILQAIADIAVYLWEDVLKPLGEFLGTVFVAAWNVVSDAAGWLWENVLVPFGEFLVWFWNSVLVPIGSVLVDVLGVAFQTVADIAKSFWENVLVPLGNALAEMFGPAVEAVSAVLSFLWNDVFVPLAEFLISIFKPIIEALIEVFEFLWRNVFKPLAEFVGSVFVAVFDNMFKSIGDIIGGLKNIFIGLMDFITGVFTGDWEKAWEGIRLIFKGVFDALWGIVKAPLNLIIDGINWVIGGLNKISFSLPSWIPGVGGKTFGINIPEIPKLARGGIVTAPTLAMIGERGPEAVVPLGRSGFAGDLADTVAQAVYQAIMDAIRISRASSPQSTDEKEIVLKIDNAVLARMQLPALTREAERQGFDLVLRPQGV